MPIKFRFSWIALFATAVVVAIGVSAGQWQTRRGDQKEAIEARLQQRGAEPVVELDGADVQPDALEFRRIRVGGEFVPGWAMYLDNRPYQGRAGFYLLMPFKIAGSDRAVLVARGWFPRDAQDRSKVPDITTPQGLTEVQGVARRGMGRLLEFGSHAAPRALAIVQNAEVADVAAASKLNLLPIVVAQTNDAQDGLVRDWPRPSSGVAMHRGYAFQWYGLAATALAFFVITGFRRGRKQQ